MNIKLLVAFSALWWFSCTAAAPSAAAQPAQLTEQQKLKERVDALESQLKDAQTKADRGAMEKDYIERLQKETKDFYEKAFNSQMWTLGIMGVILTAVFGLTARFGLSIFDRRIQDSLRDASTQLETKFDQKLGDELQKLKDSNATQMKQLEEALTKRINQTEADLGLKSNFQFQFAQGLGFLGDDNHKAARYHFRLALANYSLGKARQVIKSENAKIALANISRSLLAEDHDHYLENARREFADSFYNDFEDELDAAALLADELIPLIRERKQGPPPAQSARPTAAPATEHESPTSAPATEKAQPAKPKDSKNK